MHSCHIIYIHVPVNFTIAIIQYIDQLRMTTGSAVINQTWKIFSLNILIVKRE